MSDDQLDQTRKTGQSESGAGGGGGEYGARPPRDENPIPRRGYERRRDATGSLRSPTSGYVQPPPDESPSYQSPPPPVYGSRPSTLPPPRRGRKRQRVPRDSGLYLPWWSLVILIVFVGGASFGLLYFAANLGGVSLNSQTPQFIVVTGALQPTPVGQNAAPPTTIPTTQPTFSPDLPTPIPSRTPLPGGCLLNDEVIVFGTGGVGLNLRDEPGGEVAFIAKEGERMLVIDGPVFFDDVQWCQVRSTSQSSSFGWASLEFLLAADAVEDSSDQ